MHQPWSIPILAAICLCCTASCQSSRKAPALAIVRSQAETAALAEAPGGVITHGELTKRGEQWVWAFQTVMPGLASPRELLVNASTGDVIPRRMVAQHEMAGDNDMEVAR